MGVAPVGRQPKAFSEKPEQNSLVVLQNSSGRGGERHPFLWTNLGLRYLIEIFCGSWARFLPWHMEVHVQICYHQERALGHLQHLAGGAAGLPPPAWSSAGGQEDGGKGESAWSSPALRVFAREAELGFRCLSIPDLAKTEQMWFI